jgi:BRCT domain type II-containing protein
LLCGRPRCPLKQSGNNARNQRIKEIKRLWIIKMDNTEYLKKLMDGMPRRLEEVFARQGASTKYWDP